MSMRGQKAAKEAARKLRERREQHAEQDFVRVIGPRTFTRLETKDGGLIYIGHSKGSVEMNALARAVIEGLKVVSKKKTRRKPERS